VPVRAVPAGSVAGRVRPVDPDPARLPAARPRPAERFFSSWPPAVTANSPTARAELTWTPRRSRPVRPGAQLLGDGHDTPVGRNTNRSSSRSLSDGSPAGPSGCSSVVWPSSVPLRRSRGRASSSCPPAGCRASRGSRTGTRTRPAAWAGRARRRRRSGPPARASPRRSSTSSTTRRSIQDGVEAGLDVLVVGLLLLLLVGLLARRPWRPPCGTGGTSSSTSTSMTATASSSSSSANGSSAISRRRPRRAPRGLLDQLVRCLDFIDVFCHVCLSVVSWPGA